MGVVPITGIRKGKAGLAAVYRDGKVELIPNSIGEFLTPSVAGIDDHDNICVGTKTFLPQELSAFVLRQLKHDAEVYLGEAVTEAVISVPAYFDKLEDADD